jgi:P-type Cu+ transporter
MDSTCYHCGDTLPSDELNYKEQKFCCQGCVAVYQLLNESSLSDFYQFEKNPGVKPRKNQEELLQSLAFLEIAEIRTKYIQYEDEEVFKTKLFLPEIHCSSCIYLLENSSKIEPGILECEVNFIKKEAVFTISKKALSLKDLAVFLSKVGYVPNFGERKEQEKKIDKRFLTKLGIAGFAFGSIMLWSFPEYLGIDQGYQKIRTLASALSLIVSIPVLLYSAQDYFISAWKVIRHKSINLDVPISIGILALYFKSVASILQAEGPGYMDSFAGFIFFLLIGKWFQNKTYQSLSFDRDYRSYFPVAILKVQDNQEVYVEIDALKENDIILVRNQEIIPCDSELLDDTCEIDYSFVTGESTTVTKHKHELLYAGGKIEGKRTKFKVLKASNRSHLTQLWNSANTTKKISYKNTQDKISIYFLVALLVVTSLSALLWFFIDQSRIVDIVVSILIVACPCALALAAPFTYGNILRLLGRKKLYLKNTEVIESMNGISDIIFDKTGTLTQESQLEITYTGTEIPKEHLGNILSCINSSTHPLSVSLAITLKQKFQFEELKPVEQFLETKGKGIRCTCLGYTYKIGSLNFLNRPTEVRSESIVGIEIDNIYYGFFSFPSKIRSGIPELIEQLEKKYKLHLLSGDNNSGNEKINNLFNATSPRLYNQSPQEKFDYVEHLQASGKKVMMIGDGLNDSGALGIADVGIAVSENIFRFTPSSDGIIEASEIKELSKLLRASSFSKKVLFSCLVFSTTYNIIGLSFAISGKMSPLLAAILMPLSSITVVLISTGLVAVYGRIDRNSSI